MHHEPTLVRFRNHGRSCFLHSSGWLTLLSQLGGDGTVLFASWLFQRVSPPVIPFSLGSLGFLTNQDFKNYEKVLSGVANEGVRSVASLPCRANVNAVY